MSNILISPLHILIFALRETSFSDKENGLLNVLEQINVANCYFMKKGLSICYTTGWDEKFVNEFSLLSTFLMYL